MGHRIERSGHLQPRRGRLDPEGAAVEGEIAVLEEAPGNPRDTIFSMPGAPVPARIEVPRWVQLVGLPLLLLLIWVVAGAVRHAVFIFLVALLIALLLNPLVRTIGRLWIPRGLAVAIVYLTFAAAVALTILALATVVVQQTRHASNRIDNYFTVESGRPPATGATQDLARFQGWLDGHHLKRVRVQKQGQKFLTSIGTKDVEKYTTKALNWAEGAGLAVVSLAVQRSARRRRLDLHAARHAATCGCGRPAVSTGARVDAAHRADGARARELREGPARAVADHRHELGPRRVGARHARPDAERRQVRAALRRLGRDHGVDPVRRAVARRCAARAVRARAASAVGVVGRAALPRASSSSRGTSSCRR